MIGSYLQRPFSLAMKQIFTLLLCAALYGPGQAQTYFYIDQIAVQPAPITDQDQIFLARTSGL